MKNIIYALIILIAVFACKKDEVALKKPGYFILTELKSPQLKNARIDSVKTQFSLGDIKASKEYYFILSNGGDNPIYDVEFKSDNPAFKVFPEKINELAGAKTVNNLIPLISLNVIHGTQLNGIGYTNLLPMNINSATITISGKIIENGDSVKIASTYSFKVNAKVMDVGIFAGDQEIDLTKPFASTSSNLGGLGFIRLYNVSSNKLTFKNTGNVDIHLTTYQQDNSIVIKGQPIPIATGSAIQLVIKQEFSTIELDSDGTITNDTRIQLGNNGKGYFGLYLNQMDTLKHN